MTAPASAGAGQRGAPRVALVGVPFSSAGRPGGIGTAISVLRGEGLRERLSAAADVHDLGDLAPVAPTAQRATSGLLDEPSLTVLVGETRRAVTTARRAGLRPLLVGGDCPVMLGALSALRAEHGRVGLVMVDGHEDTWPPQASPTGEASDSELGIALGLFGDLPSDLADVCGVLDPAAVALLGPRDRDDLQAAGLPSLLSTLGAFVDADGIPERPRALVRRVVDGLDAPAWWLHVDLDVLRTEDFPAVDYRQPGGLTWDQLTELTVTAWRAPACAGASIAIYNPDLDPHRSSARRLTDFLCELVSSPTDPRTDEEP